MVGVKNIIVRMPIHLEGEWFDETEFVNMLINFVNFKLDELVDMYDYEIKAFVFPYEMESDLMDMGLKRNTHYTIEVIMIED